MAVDALALAEIGLRVADLALWLDGRASGVPLMAPPSYLRFLDAGPPGDRLILQVVDSSPPPTDGWRSLYDDAETWHLWRDAEGRHVFVSPRHAPPARQVTVDTAFRSGHVVGAFSASLGRAQAVYPLDSIDIVLFANWLAETGGAITLFLATGLGIPVSTTHTITGAIVGVGAAKKVSGVRWGVANSIVLAWIITIPCAAAISALCFFATRLFG